MLESFGKLLIMLDALRYYKIDPCDFPVPSSKRDYHMFKKVNHNDTPIFIEINYRISDGCFIGEVEFRHHYR